MKYPLLNSLTLESIKNKDLKLDIKIKEVYKKTFDFLKDLKKEKILQRYILTSSIVIFLLYAFSSFDYKWIPFLLFIILYPILALHQHPKIKLKWEIKNFFYLLKPKHLIAMISIFFIIFIFFWFVIFLILPLLELHAHRVFFYLLAIPAFFALFLINAVFLIPFINKISEILKITIYLIKSSFLQLTKMWLVMMSFQLIVELYLYLGKSFSEYHILFLFFYILILLPVTIASVYVVIHSFRNIFFNIK